MSNRGRRAWLLNARMKAAVKYGCGDLLMNQGDNCATYAEYKGVVRQTVLEIDRPPLSFASNRQGSDSFGGSLINIQARNAPLGFDLLRSNLDDILNQAESCWLWFDYQERVEEAGRVFMQARQLLSKHRKVSLPSRKVLQWTAKMHKAARSLLYRRSSVFQYEDRFSSVVQSAQWFWPECNDLDDSEVLALMAADQAYTGVSILVELIRSFDKFASEDDIDAKDDKRLSGLRRELSEREREESWYGFRKLGRAKDLLYLAQLAEMSKDSTLVRQRLEEQEQEYMRREAAANKLVKKGAAFSHEKGSGRRSLYRVAHEILQQEGKKTPARQVWEKLKDYAGGDDIYEVTDDEVSWYKADGSLAEPTSFVTFQKQLSEVRKKL